jgi:predicted transcriptional regulator
MAKASTTATLKLSLDLKARVAAVAKRTGRSAHRLMLDAIEERLDHEERMRAFVQEALAADGDVEHTGEVYRAVDVHAWIERLARGKKTPRPKPWRR